jgi:hypothetical protein
MKVGDWVWFTDGPYRGEYGQIVAIDGPYATVIRANRYSSVSPLTHLRIAAHQQ